MENCDEWLEFGRSPPHLIAGSTFLGFDGSYNDLQHVGRWTLENINLGKEQLKNAVNQLATSKNSQDRARSLIIVIQMICESIRFKTISEHFAADFPHSHRLPGKMLALEHGWGDLSDALLRADIDPQHRFPLPQPNAMEIMTVDQAAAVLGILLDPSRLHPRISQMVNDIQGRPLVEVFSVRVNSIDNEDPVDLHGTITVTDGLGSQHLYKRTRDEYESIHPGQNALLTGPSRAISAYGSFAMDVALMDRHADSPPDGEVCGQMYWNVYNATNEYDSLLHHQIDGKNGSVTVKYVVLSDAAEATVEITLGDGDGDGEKLAHVYGRLSARNGIGESHLFRKGPDEAIDVLRGQLISLSRSVVAVPLNSCVVVVADLHDHDSDAPPDGEIASGTVEFPAQLQGASEQNIEGENGSICVKVTWNQDFYH